MGLSGLLALGAGPARAEPAQGEAAAPVDANAEAKALYASGRYLEAARAFEAIWRSSGRTGSLFNAGMAREAAGLGNLALAVHHWRRYLEAAGAEAAGAERRALARRIQAAEAKMVGVELVLTRGEGGELAPPRYVELVRNGGSAADQLRIEWQAAWSSHVLYLDPGGWSAVVVEAEGSRQTRAFVVSAGAAGLVQVLLRAELPLGRSLSEGKDGATRVGLRLRPTRALARLHARSVTVSAGEEEWHETPSRGWDQDQEGGSRRSRGRKRGRGAASRSAKGVEVAWVAEEAEEGSPSTADPAGSEWYVRPGGWRLRAWAPGFRAAELALTVAEEPLEVSLRLRRDAMGRARIGVAAAEGLGSLGLLAAGGWILGDNAPDLDFTLGSMSQQDTEKRAQDRERIRRVSEGWWLLGGGLGLGMTALTVAAGGGEGWLLTEATLGGAALAVAIPRMVENVQNCYTDARTEELIKGCYHRGVPSALAMGAGAGMLGGALLALIGRAAARRMDRTRAIRLGVRGGATGGSVVVLGGF